MIVTVHATPGKRVRRNIGTDDDNSQYPICNVPIIMGEEEVTVTDCCGVAVHIKCFDECPDCQ